MEPKPMIGLDTCPECGFPDAKIKEDKRGRAYRWCPDCEVTLFTRNAAQDARLRARMRPTTAPVTPAGPDTPATPEPAAPAPKPAKRASLLIS